MNVFLDLVIERVGNEESRALEEGWLTDEIELVVAPELFQEIAKWPNESERHRRRIEAARYRRVVVDPGAVSEHRTALKQAGGPSPSDRTIADLNYVAQAAAAGVKYLVSRDTELLARAEFVQELLDLTILRPSELITHLHEVKDSAAYRPVQLEGTSFRVERLGRNHDLGKIVTSFLNFRNSERAPALRATLRQLLADPNESEVLVVVDEARSLRALLARRRKTGTIQLPVLRVSPHKAATTLARQLLAMQIRENDQRGVTSIVLDDAFLSPEVAEAVALEPYLPVSTGLRRISVRGIHDLNKLREVIHALKPPIRHAIHLIDDVLARIPEPSPRSRSLSDCFGQSRSSRALFRHT